MIQRILAILAALLITAHAGGTLTSAATTYTQERLTEGSAYQISAGGTWAGATITVAVFNHTLGDYVNVTTLTSTSSTKRIRATGQKLRATISGGSGTESLAFEALRLPVETPDSEAAIVDNDTVNTATQTALDGKLSLALTNPLPTLSRSGSSFLTFKRSDITANGGKADFGQLGTAEANMAWNMDFTLGTGNHRYWDSTIGATWASCSSQATWNSFSVQYAPAGLSGGDDIWTLAGYPYLFSAHADLTHGACMFIGGNTARNDSRGPTMSQYSRLVIVRGTSQADISGDDGGLKLEGQAPGGWGTGINDIYLNTISNGTISTGTGNFKIGSNAFFHSGGNIRVGNSATYTATPGRPFEVAPAVALANQTSGDFYVDSNGTVYVGRLTTDSGGGNSKQIWQGRTGTAQMTFDAGGAGTTPTATFAALVTSTNTTDATSSAGAIKTSGGVSVTKGIYLGTVMTGTEQASEPAAPAANGWVVYGIDDGAGKTKLMVKFSSGAAQQLSIEP